MKNALAATLRAGLLAGLIASPVARSAEGDLPTVFVAPFNGDRTAIQYWQPAMGEGLAEMLITELGKLNKYSVLESTQVEALKDEIRMGEDGWVEQSEKVDKGGFSAADFMFTARVTRFGAKSTGVGLGGVGRGLGIGNLGIKQNNADVRIDWRLVDANNRKILKTGSAVGEQKGTGFDIGVFVKGSGGNIGFDNKEFMDSALGKATVQALEKITAELRDYTPPVSSRKLQKATQAQQATQATDAAAQAAAASAAAAADALRKTPGKVIAVASKNAIIVSLGAAQGFKAGEVVRLFETIDTKDDQGNVVFTEEKPVGELKLEAVQDDRSRASCLGDLEVKPGWIVRAK